MLKALGASASLLSTPVFSLPASGNIFLSAANIDGANHARLFNEAGRLLGDIKLPGRGHGGAFNTTNKHGVLFARRPGNFAIVFAPKGQVLHTLTTPPERHFYGHGIFSQDGRLLFTTENDYENTRGIIGIWDVRDQYTRIGEFNSAGVGPHDISLMPDKRTLVVANGGIETHPDTGRRKLNIPDMEPTLALIDSMDGKLIASHSLPKNLNKLSIRHLAVNQAGTIGAALQYQGPSEDLLPLVFTLNNGRLKLLSARKSVQQAMKNYCGSIAMDRSGTLMAVSSPRGNLVTFWLCATGELITTLDVQDVCGLAATSKPFVFVLSGGTGERLIYNAKSKLTMRLPSPSHAQWDNHIQSTTNF